MEYAQEIINSSTTPFIAVRGMSTRRASDLEDQNHQTGNQTFWPYVSNVAIFCRQNAEKIEITFN